MNLSSTIARERKRSLQHSAELEAPGGGSPDSAPGKSSHGICSSASFMTKWEISTWSRNPHTPGNPFGTGV